MAGLCVGGRLVLVAHLGNVVSLDETFCESLSILFTSDPQSTQCRYDCDSVMQEDKATTHSIPSFQQ